MNASLLFVPPLVIFIIGSALIWALRDFALPSNAETSASNHRFRGITASSRSLRRQQSSEVQASAYALASAAGFLVGLAAAKVGGSFEQCGSFEHVRGARWGPPLMVAYGMCGHHPLISHQRVQSAQS